MTIGSEISGDSSIFYNRENWDQVFLHMLNKNGYMKQMIEEAKEYENNKPFFKKIFSKTKKAFERQDN